MSGHHEHERTVEIAVLGTEFEANTLVSELEARGIDATIVTDSSGGLTPQLVYADGARVVVFENDVAAARQVVADLFPDNG